MAGNFVENSNLNSPAQDAGDAHGVLQIVAQLLKGNFTYIIYYHIIINVYVRKEKNVNKF